MTAWQQEKMYSEEDMRKAFRIGHQCARQGSYNAITEQEDFDKWKELGYPMIFEQYKTNNMTQQTLEEASKQSYPIEGAEWQQEQDKESYHPYPYRLAKSDFNF